MSSSNREFFCPYYTSNGMNPNCIRCCAEEGERNNRIILPDTESWQQYTIRYCASPHGWTFCSVAQCYQSYFERKDYNDV